MNLKEAKIMLEKINRLYESMILDSKIDPFEQELMLSYIKKLYTAFSINGDSIHTSRETQKVVPKNKKVSPPPPPPRSSKMMAPPSDPEEVKLMEEAVAKAATPKPAPKPTPKPKATPPPAAPPVKSSASIDEDILALFENNKGKELSDKLAELPIKDLTKAMGLNERVLTVNELFAKDQTAFTTLLNQLNSMGSFDEAKKLLVACAVKYKWASTKKKKKAMIFIKLVRRRFK